ncbi:MAG: Poly(3-hydroxyalkanoate) depolymerase [Myxococcaceae bacterium]|nr:Poly(3-hydroxyalkanoate) depolymerase [Myxococcaceae bacterium]
MKKLPTAAWPLALLVAVASGCGGSPTPADAALDHGAVDTGATDAGTTDAGTTDAGVAPTDAGASFHNCAVYVDRTADGADRTVRFSNFRYDPPCMLVAAGQRVTFAGDFAVHQFRPGVAPSRTAADPASPPGNPMSARDDGTTAAFDFAAPGTFPFFCLDHEGTGMYGAVRVR